MSDVQAMDHKPSGGSRESRPSIGSITHQEKDDEEVERSPGICKKIALSPYFDYFIQCVIISNTVVLALEADNPNNETFDTVDDIFLSIYTGELVIRLIVYKCNFFCNQDWRWNCFDLAIVSCGLLDQFMFHDLQETNSKAKSMSKLIMAFRMLRMVRVARAFRLLASFPELARLTTAMVESMQAVLWVGVFFFFLIFVFSIFVATMVGQQPELFEDPAEIQRWFGTVTNSMTTLAIYLTLDDWSTSARMVNEVFPWFELVWIFYIVAGAFMILSLLTGLMAEKMGSARSEEEENDNLTIKELEEKLEAARSDFPQDLDVEQFTDMVMSPHIQEIFEKCDLKISGKDSCAWFFKAIDRDQNGILSWDEFEAACRDIGSNKDQNDALREVLWMERQIIKMNKLLNNDNVDPAWEEWTTQLNDVQGRSTALKARMSCLQADLKEFLDGYAVGMHSPAE